MREQTRFDVIVGGEDWYEITPSHVVTEEQMRSDVMVGAVV